MFVDALPSVLAPAPLVAMIGATILGVLIGALPGLNPVMAIALLLPLTYTMDPIVALAMIAGIYNGSMYGGAIPAILLRIPGTPAAIATTFDGYPLNEKGEAARALKIACWSSAFGGVASALALMTIGPVLARGTLAFGPAEYFWVAALGMSSVGVLVSDNVLKGLMAAVFGLLLGTVGLDMLSGQARFTFGQPFLLGGVDLIVILVGLFALPPVLQLCERADLNGMSSLQLRLQNVRLGFRAVREHFATWIRSSAIGIFVGILPGAGGNVAAFLSYNAARSAAQDPETFGKGNTNGVAAAECGNNADNAAAMIPALTLGIPGNVIAALVLGALLIHGLQPGPRLFHQNPTLIAGFMLQLLFTAMLIILVGGIAASRVFAQAQRLPGVVMAPAVLILMTVGVFVINGRTLDLWIMFLAGIAGYLLEKVRVPAAPIILGMILGPMAERSLRRALLISRGDWTELFTRPISVGLALATFFILVLPIVRAIVRRWRVGRT